MFNGHMTNEASSTFFRELVRGSKVLHLVDAENLIGRTDFIRAEAANIRVAYESVAPMGTVNQIVVATSHYTAMPVWLAWPIEARRLLRSGPDGADIALLGVLAEEDVTRRFDRIVIGSGDGIFAVEAARLQSGGCEVTVVTRRDALSSRLRLAVRDVRFIDVVPAASRALISEVRAS